MLCYRGSDNQLSSCSCMSGAAVKALSINKYAASHTKANQSSLNCSLPFHSNAILANGQRIQGIIRLAPPRPSSLDSRISCRIPSRLASFLFFPASLFSCLAFVSARSCLVSLLSCLRFCLGSCLSCLVSFSWSLGILVARSRGLLDSGHSIPWSLWLLGMRSVGPLVAWSLGPSVPWYLGLLVPWPLGLLVYQYFGLLVSGSPVSRPTWSLRLFAFGLLVSWPLVSWSISLSVSWCHCILVLLVSRSLGPLVTWSLGFLASWSLGLLASGLLPP